MSACTNQPSPGHTIRVSGMRRTKGRGQASTCPFRFLDHRYWSRTIMIAHTYGKGNVRNDHWSRAFMIAHTYVSIRKSGAKGRAQASICPFALRKGAMAWLTVHYFNSIKFFNFTQLMC